MSAAKDEDVPSTPGLWCSSEPGLISIQDPIHNPGLRDQGPNEEMKHHGKVAFQSSKDGRGTAEEALFLVDLSLFLSFLCDSCYLRDNKMIQLTQFLAF